MRLLLVAGEDDTIGHLLGRKQDRRTNRTEVCW